MKEALKPYFKLAIASIKSRMEYRASFIAFLISATLFYSAQIATIGIIVYRFRAIGGWNAGEIAFLYSLLILSQSIVSFIFSGLLEFSNLVREGVYDRYLLRPLSSLGQVIMGSFEIGGFANLLMGILTFVLANSMVSIQWNTNNIFFFILSILGGSFILGGIRIFISAIAFYAINNQSLIHLFVFSSREFLLYPVNIYSYGVRFLLTFTFPLAFVNFYPAQYFLVKNSVELYHPYFRYATFPVGIIVLISSLIFWKYGEKAYESAGA